MSILRKVIKLNKEEYYKRHLLVINYMLPIQMTNKEAEVLAAFMSLEGDLENDPFSTTGRKIVRSKLGISAGGLGNYLNQLKDKHFILEDEGVMKILPFLKPDKEEQEYHFKLRIHDS